MGLWRLIFRKKPESISIPNKIRKVWGNYTVLERGKRYQIKLLEINPNHSISRQHHLHRVEIWTIVEGKVLVFYDNRVREMELGDRIFIPAHAIHGVENRQMVAAKIVEVQCGSYLSEDDIVRHTQSR